MHIYVIAAFALLFWESQSPPAWRLWASDDRFATLLAVIGGIVTWTIVATVFGWRARRLIRRHGDGVVAGVEFHHRSTFFLRIGVTLWFAGLVVLTPWGEWFDWSAEHPWLQIFGDLLVLSPFFLQCVLLWLIAFPLERRLREGEEVLDDAAHARWRLSSYLDFNIRHHLLVVAVPMTLILFASNVTRGYERELRRAVGVVWAPDLTLGIVAGVVFLIAPMLLRRIWRTSPLPPGPLRERLEVLCRRIGLRCRDILIWNSDGLMINAAVMGVFPPVRYVLLSDALLSTMTPRQVEAVFGHEAGHVRHRHIQHFLIFALVGWMVVAGIMELLARGSIENGGGWPISFAAIEGVGVVATIAFWTLGFGWVSRRFERQADLYGARCVTPEALDCDRPCGVHLDASISMPADGRICATAASVFASALHRVAILNGIPPEERSWRHSSIASRIRFLTSLAGDPARARGFERSVQRIKLALVTTAVLGAVATVAYWRAVPRPALLRMQADVSAAMRSP